MRIVKLELPYDIQMLNAVVAHPAAYETRAYTSDCFDGIAEAASVHPAVLAAYLLTENAPAGHIRKNSDGSYDVASMQVNSINWETFYKNYGIQPLRLRFDGCVNLMAGAKLVRNAFDRHGKRGIDDWSTFYQVAAEYHSATKKHNVRYQEKWIENFKMILEDGFEF